MAVTDITDFESEAVLDEEFTGVKSYKFQFVPVEDLFDPNTCYVNSHMKVQTIGLVRANNFNGYTVHPLVNAYTEDIEEYKLRLMFYEDENWPIKQTEYCKLYGYLETDDRETNFWETEDRYLKVTIWKILPNYHIAKRLSDVIKRALALRRLP